MSLTAKEIWSLGDYHRFATELVWELGPMLVSAAGIRPGQRVLDVAAGSGNVALRAAEAGARVVASDLSPTNLEAGRREASARGLSMAIDWVEADACALPFADGEFDVVTSSLGVMFAADHRAAADELLRVCRPGGTIALLSFTPEGLGGHFFGIFAGHLPPPPPGALPPVLWGSEPHIHELFGDRVESLEMVRKEYVERSPGGPGAYCELFKATFGPVIAIYRNLADRSERRAALDRELLEFASRANRGDRGGAAEYVYEVLQVVARKSA